MLSLIKWKNVHLALVFVLLFILIAPLGNHSADAAQIEGGSREFVQISAGGHHALALKADGTVVGWGDNSWGQTNIPTGLSDVVSIAAGYFHSLALKADGTVVGWGRNVEGQISVPGGLAGVKSIVAGTTHSLALKMDGTVVAWGGNDFGERNVPTGLTDVVSIASGALHSMAIKSDGTVVAWGYNINGQTNVGGLEDVVSIATGPIAYHSLALKADGTVVAWGANSDNSTIIPSGLLNVVAVATGLYHSLALKSDGTVVAWGKNNDGQSTVPQGLSDVVSIAAGEHFSLALKADGTVVAWGSNNYGKTTVPAAFSLPVKGDRIAAGLAHSLALKSDGTVVEWGVNYGGSNVIPAGLAGVAAIAAGTYHSLALKSDGTVVAWKGFNSSGELSVPEGLADVVSIAAGLYHSLALKADGTVVGWGSNGSGQRIPPAGLADAVAIAAGEYHSLALKSDGTVVGWGDTSYGKVTPPVGLTGVVSIAAAANHSLALKSNGTVVGWGLNTYDPISVPTGLTGVVAIATGTSHSLALKSDGTVVAWGTNAYGQTSVPTGLSGVVAIACGDFHSLALKADGTVVGWGRGSEGQTTTPGNDNLSALTLQEGEFNESFQSSDTTYTAYFKDTLPNSANLTATLNNTPRADLYVNDEWVASGTAATINVPGAPTSFDIPVRVEPYLKPSKTYTVTLAIDETEPSVQFSANGRATAAQSAASAVTVSDTESGVDSASLQYAWTQSAAVPAGGWTTFGDGDTLSQTSGDGNWYLHVRASDKVGNVVDSVSNPFLLDNTAPTATVSTSAGGTVNADFPVTITFSEGIHGFTEDDLVIGNGTVSNLVSVTSTTYTATVSPTTSGQAVTVMVSAGAVTDTVGMSNTVSNTLNLLYDTTKPTVTFGSFTDGHRFIMPPAAVTVSVSEAVYWIAGGTLLNSANALPLISMQKDGQAFSAYTPSYDELSRTFTLSFNGTLEDGDYEMLVAGNAVRNVFQNTLDAANASFTVAVPIITEIFAAPTSLLSAGGSTIATISGTHLIGQTVTVYVDGVKAATAVVNSATRAEATISLPSNATQTARNHLLTVYLNGVEVSGQTSTVTVGAAPTPSVTPTPTAPSSMPSGQADLAKLTITISGKVLELSPAFSPGTNDYSAVTDAEQVEFQVSSAQSKAIVKLLGERIDGTKNIPLSIGANVLAITVQAEDGTIKKYTVTINRVAKNENTTPPTSACSFTDIEKHWAKSSICEAAGLGIVEGVSTHSFEPNRYVTRTEFAIMLQRALEIPIRTETSAVSFSDRDNIPEWARQAIQTAVAESILAGYPDGTLQPMQTVTRTEMAAMISRAMKWKARSTTSPSFSDDASIPAWAKAYVEAARDRGILEGRAGNQFVPDGLTTRAEAAVALLRLWKTLQ
ncbi:S-layer homology domain-containing protein [Cohnella sp. WQ 127256]|uniref:S-layer homology domain-containing protein n=1 Tax=Cohnella sp. WQ 127256 TaxID=2938790 RepID=UPI00211991F4|nr:S-layer homology domain-containing protein [Cohnella sp. WQ 127256]